MCLIVYNPTGAELPMNEIRTAFGNNNDGFGIMWPENGRVKSIKGLFNFKEISDLIKARKGKPYAFHMRWRTVGAIGVDQCHPFKTLNMEDGESQDLYMMHNGTFSGLNDKVKSDTELFNECVQEYLSKKNPEEIDTLIKTEINSCVSAANKVLFMDGDGKTFIAGEHRGLWISSVWYSNLYSFYATKNLRTNNEIIMSIVYGSAIHRRVSLKHPSVLANYNVAVKSLPVTKGKSVKKGSKYRGGVATKSTVPPPPKKQESTVQKFEVRNSVRSNSGARRYNPSESFEFNFGVFDYEPDDENSVYDIGMNVVTDDDNVVFDATLDDDEVDFGPIVGEDEKSDKGIYLNRDYNETQTFLALQANNRKPEATRTDDKKSTSKLTPRRLRKLSRRIAKLSPDRREQYVKNLDSKTISALLGYEETKISSFNQRRKNGKEVRHIGVYSSRREV